MRKLPVPDDDPVEVFKLCTSTVNDKDLSQRYTTVEDIIKLIEDEYRKAAMTGTLYTLAPHNGMIGSVSVNEMVKVYTYRMVDKRLPGRRIYDKLLIMIPKNWTTC